MPLSTPPAAQPKRPSFDDIRACQPEPMSEGLLGLIERKASLPITWLLVQTPISANQATLLWWLVGLLGAGLLASGIYLAGVLGALCFLLVLVLDDVDGEIARYRRAPSMLGVFLDLAGHHVVKSALFIGLALGSYPARQQTGLVILGLSACLSLVVADSLRFYRHYLLERNRLQPAPRSRLTRVVSRLETPWRSQGLYLVTLLGALLGRPDWLLVFYGFSAPLWMLSVLMRAVRELGALSTPGAAPGPEI